MSNYGSYALPPDPSSSSHQQPQQSFFPPPDSAFASNAALGLAQMASHGSGSGGGGGGSGHEGSASVEPEGKGKGPQEGEKKKQTRGARACTVCRKLKMRCVDAEDGPPCKRCKNGGHECIFEESQRGKRSNRKTDAMAKSLKSMEAKLESVLASISNPGMLAGSGGLVSDPTVRLPPESLNSGPFGAEGRGDVPVLAGPLDTVQVASALEQFRTSGGGAARGLPAPAHAPSALQGQGRERKDSNSAITRKDPIVLPSIAATEGVRFEVGGGVGSHADIGPSLTGGHPRHPHPHPHVHFGPGAVYGAVGVGAVGVGVGAGGKGYGGLGSGGSSSKSSPMEWSGIKDPAAADGSPRLHSLPDNTLNPLGLLAEASLRNTRKRPQDISAEVYDVTGDLHHSDGEGGGRTGASSSDGGAKGAKGKGKGKGKEVVEEEEDGPQAKRRKVDEGEDGKGAKKPMGMANRNYFAPGPMNILPLRRIVIEQRMPPALLEEKILSVEEVVELFELYFTQCARHCPFLDPEIHTPAATGSRSPFLFTCICTVAARYYTKRTDDLYRKCLRVAKRVAFDVMTKGYKSTEICQGFLLLCNWNQPAERFEEERTYQFSGIAIRMATDLNLHRKTIAQLPPDIGDETRVLYERELLNRERTWLYAFICDRSVATQMGKPYSISKEDFIIRSAPTWHRQVGNQPSDSGLSAMVEMQRIVGRMIDVLYSDTRSVSGLNAHLDYPMLIRAFLQQLDQWRQEWSDPAALKDDPDEEALSGRAIMRDPSSSIDLPSYCVLCFESAERMIVILRDHLYPQNILRYAIDSTFVYASYAATFLLKLVSPTFASFIDEDAAMRLVRETAEVLENSAIDEQHTPALYASFLRMLIENKLHGPRTAANSRAPTRPGSPDPSGLTGLGSANGTTSAFASSSAYTNGNGVGLESFIKSRAPSIGPEGYAGLNGASTPSGGFGFDPTLGGAFPGGLGDATFGFGTGGELNAGGDGGPAFDSLMVDDVLSANGFWSSIVFSNNPADPFTVTPFHSRPPSPSQLGGTFGSSSGAGAGPSAAAFDFSVPSFPAAAPATAPATAPAPATAAANGEDAKDEDEKMAVLKEEQLPAVASAASGEEQPASVLKADSASSAPNGKAEQGEKAAETAPSEDGAVPEAA
ncbi:hypothetical protein JCM10213v2_006120 [Rhodosporidiobolus nylandii]